MPGTSKGPRGKGKRGERAFRDVLISHGFHARRGQQFSGNPDAPDVISEGLPIRWEVKFGASHSLPQAFRQCDAEAGGKIPIVASKRDRSEWMVYLRASDFLKILKNNKCFNIGWEVKYE